MFYSLNVYRSPEDELQSFLQESNRLYESSIIQEGGVIGIFEFVINFIKNLIKKILSIFSGGGSSGGSGGGGGGGGSSSSSSSNIYNLIKNTDFDKLSDCKINGYEIIANYSAREIIENKSQMENYKDNIQSAISDILAIIKTITKYHKLDSDDEKIIKDFKDNQDLVTTKIFNINRHLEKDEISNFLIERAIGTQSDIKITNQMRDKYFKYNPKDTQDYLNKVCNQYVIFCNNSLKRVEDAERDYKKNYGSGLTEYDKKMNVYITTALKYIQVVLADFLLMSAIITKLGAKITGQWDAVYIKMKQAASTAKKNESRIYTNFYDNLQLI